MLIHKQIANTSDESYTGSQLASKGCAFFILTQKIVAND